MKIKQGIIVLSLVIIILALNQCGKKKIPVVISTSVKSGSIVGSSEVNACDLFIKRNPNTQIDIRVIDDEWKPDKVREKIAQAMESGISFFVTAHPSNSAIQVMDLFQDGKAMAFITSSTTELLTGKDDYIFRVISDLIEEQKQIARYISGMPGKKVLIIRDTSNPPYTEPALKYFREELNQLSKKEIVVYGFNVEYFDQKILNKALKEKYDILYILAGIYHAAVIGNIAQFFFHKNPNKPIILTPWARIPSLIQTSGPAISNIILASQYESKFKNEKIQKFFSEFKKEFHYEPISLSIGVYQSLEILDKAFSEGCRTPKEVKDYLLKQKEFKTSLEDIQFDQYGDRKTKFYFIRNLQKEFE